LDKLHVIAASEQSDEEGVLHIAPCQKREGRRERLWELEEGGRNLDRACDVASIAAEIRGRANEASSAKLRVGGLGGK
jgi:hypothetical protein